MANAFWRGVVVAGLALGLTGVEAQVRVTKGAGQKAGLDLSGFTAAAGGAAATFRRTLEGDLVLSGWFTPAGRGMGEIVVSGGAADSGAGVDVQCQVAQRSSGAVALSRNYRAEAAEARRLAHRVADEIIAAVTGRKGFLSARLALVGNRSGSKELYLCDADGQNLMQLTSDKTISIAPQWGPQGDVLVYTSYLKKYPDVYLIRLATGQRERIANYPGLNTGAAISPDGRYVALILSKDGNPDLYIKPLGGGAPTRLTSTPRAAEASPSWSPDGSRIVFVSDQSGTPQLYVVARQGGAPRRITSRGSQNVAPDWGANGLIAYASLVGGHFQVYVLDPNTLEIKQVSPGDADYEDPSWAPDGRHIACGRARQYQSHVYLLDTMGDPPVPLVAISGDWYSPAWSAR